MKYGWVYVVTVLDWLALVLVATGHLGWAVLVLVPAGFIGAVGLMAGWKHLARPTVVDTPPPPVVETPHDPHVDT